MSAIAQHVMPRVRIVFGDGRHVPVGPGKAFAEWRAEARELEAPVSNCPKCDRQVPDRWTRSCPHCGTRLAYCPKCRCHSELVWRSSPDTPSAYSLCTECWKPIPETVHVRKSSIYRQFQYAFKFVNKVHVPYPMYFAEGFPFGQITEDLGDFGNDFAYEGAEGADWGTARAYRAKVILDRDTVECVAISHETGLEVFLIAAGTFAGAEVAKYSLKRVLETIDTSIQEWWKRRRKNHWGSAVTSVDQLVEKILVRTPHWELEIDGRFSAAERLALIEHIGRIAQPSPHIALFLEPLPDKTLRAKATAATRAVVKAPSTEVGDSP
jgi:hypothetical protein